MSVVLFLTLASAVLPGPVASLSRVINVTPSAAVNTHCEPFGRTQTLFSAYTYHRLPAFSLLVGDVISFDAVARNEVSVCRAIFANLLNGTSDITCGASSPPLAGSWVQIASHQCAGVGNLVAGDFDLRFSVTTPFNFTGGGFALAISAAAAPPDATCNAMTTFAACTDPSGLFGSQFIGTDSPNAAPLFLLTPARPPAASKTEPNSIDIGVITFVIVVATLVAALLSLCVIRTYRLRKQASNQALAVLAQARVPNPVVRTETQRGRDTPAAPTAQPPWSTRPRRLTFAALSELQSTLVAPRALHDRVVEWMLSVQWDAGVDEPAGTPPQASLSSAYASETRDAAVAVEPSAAPAAPANPNAVGLDGGHSVNVAGQDTTALSAPAFLCPAAASESHRSLKQVVVDVELSATHSTVSAESGPQPTRDNRVRHDSVNAETDELPTLRAPHPQTPPAARRSAVNPLSPRREAKSPLSQNPNTPGRSSIATDGTRPRVRSAASSDLGLMHVSHALPAAESCV